MKFFRKIIKSQYIKNDLTHEAKDTLLYVNISVCGWGIVTDLDVHGYGYVKFDKGGGQLIRGWNHFFDMVSSFEICDEERGS